MAVATGLRPSNVGEIFKPDSAIGSGGASSDSFKTISTSSGTAPVADSATDTLTMTGEHIDVVGDSATDTINYKGINRIRWAMFLMGG